MSFMTSLIRAVRASVKPLLFWVVLILLAYYYALAHTLPV